MRRMLLPRLIPAVFGLVLLLGADASARCIHGLLHCGYCWKTVYYSQTVTRGPVVANTNTGAAMVALPAPGQTNGAGVASAPAFSNMMAPIMSPVYLHSAYGSPTYAQPSAAQSPPSLLAGFNENAATPPVSPGTMLSNGQLFGSHILQTLRRFGQGLDKSGLLNLASKAFVDAAGFLPGNSDIAILEKIVGMVLPQPQGTQSGPGGATNSNTQVTTLSDGTTVFRITVTVEVPPGSKVQGTSTSADSPKDKPGADQPKGTNDEGVSPPPVAPPVRESAPPVPKPSASGNQRYSATATVSMRKP